MKQQNLAAAQFGATAQSYLTSSVHSQGADLQRLGRLARELGCQDALDLGCGAGHASYALAEGGAQVTAYDLSQAMLDVVAAEARQRGLPNLRTQQGPAERLPFADATFDLVATRFSAHHWLDVRAALAEARRVLKTNGTLVVIDVVAPENPLFDTVLQAVEILRDASHVRDYRVSEWGAMLQAAGFAAPASDSWTLPMEFAGWTARMRTPALRADAVRDVLAHAAQEARQHFDVKPDGSFRLDVAWLQARPRA
ncbi:MAG: class I SAM-dependent methyltransferase [Thiomonas delicata]